MKKIILSMGITSSLMFGYMCPDLSVKTSKEKKEFAEGMLSGLEHIPTIKSVYIDVLKKYNNTNNYQDYVTIEGLKDLGVTEIWGTLLASKYENNSKLYESVLNTINSKNLVWCKSSAYSEVLKDYKR